MNNSPSKSNEALAAIEMAIGPLELSLPVIDAIFTYIWFVLSILY